MAKAGCSSFFQKNTTTLFDKDSRMKGNGNKQFATPRVTYH